MHEDPTSAGSGEGLIYAVLPLQAERLFLRIEPVTYRPRWDSFTAASGPPFLAFLADVKNLTHRLTKRSNNSPSNICVYSKLTIVIDFETSRQLKSYTKSYVIHYQLKLLDEMRW